jgi:peptide chain release factor subunit 3
VVVVNKMDEPSVKWSKNRWDEIVEGVTPFLHATGFKQEQIHWVPISGITGDNLKDRVDSKVCSWFNGPSLVELINDLPLEKRYPDGPLRVPILDKLVEEGGRTVFGKVESGTIRLGDKCCLSPSELPCQIGLLKDSKGNEVEYARPGENI